MLPLLVTALAFISLHFLPGTPLRRRLVRLLGGENRYLGIFALASALLLILLIRFFAATPFDAPLWTAPLLWRWLKPLIMIFAFVLVVGGFANPNPSSPEMEDVLDDPDPAKGVLTITRHPVMWGVALWASAHLISQPNMRGLLFFGAFALTALAGSWLQQRRKARLLGEKWRRFEEATSFWPFAAILAGRARLRAADIGMRTVVIALALWSAMLHFHSTLIGVPALPQLL
jgi:uncharacterized membrane protein